MMEVNKSNTETILSNMLSEGMRSRAEYLGLMAERIEELEIDNQELQKDEANRVADMAISLLKDLVFAITIDAHGGMYPSRRIALAARRAREFVDEHDRLCA